MLKYLKNIVID